MEPLALLSSLVIVLGLAGVLPHIAAMVRRRSAAGQSPLGWSMGLGVNALMSYINIVGHQDGLLGLGNLFGACLCAVALACAVRLPRPQEDVAPPRETPNLVELPTGDLAEMLDAIAAERERRDRRRRGEAEGGAELAAA